MIREMMAQEMENFKEAVGNGEEYVTCSPVVYTTLQVLLAKIEQMPKVWRSPSEGPANGEPFAIIEGDGRLTASYTILEGGMNWEKIKAVDGCRCWAYCKDLLPPEEYKDDFAPKKED